MEGRATIFQLNNRQRSFSLTAYINKIFSLQQQQIVSDQRHRIRHKNTLLRFRWSPSRVSVDITLIVAHCCFIIIFHYTHCLFLLLLVLPSTCSNHGLFVLLLLLTVLSPRWASLSWSFILELIKLSIVRAHQPYITNTAQNICIWTVGTVGRGRRKSGEKIRVRMKSCKR